MDLYEGSPLVGGVLQSVKQDGWLVERGPNSILENSPVISDLIDSVGLGARRCRPGDAGRNRYIVKKGKLVAMPSGPVSFATSSLFGLSSKLRMLSEPFRGKATADESIASFVRRRLGTEFLDYAVDPFVSGVYAGNPERLSVRQAFPKLYGLERDHGSLFRGALARGLFRTGPKNSIVSFPDGVQELPLAIAARLGESVKCNSRVTRLNWTGVEWLVNAESPSGESEQAYTSIISTLPVRALCELALEGVPGTGALQTLRRVEYPAVVSVFLGFRRRDIAHPLDGFGLLAPTREHRDILGALFSSTLFPSRAPEGHVALTVFAGGSRRPDIVKMNDAEIISLVIQDLAPLVDIRNQPVITRVTRWEKAIPQYNLGYEKTLEACAAVERDAHGLIVGGSFRGGPSISACIESGARMADAAMLFREL